MYDQEKGHYSHLKIHDNYQPSLHNVPTYPPMLAKPSPLPPYTLPSRNQGGEGLSNKGIPRGLLLCPSPGC